MRRFSTLFHLVIFTLAFQLVYSQPVPDNTSSEHGISVIRKSPENSVPKERSMIDQGLIKEGFFGINEILRAAVLPPSNDNCGSAKALTVNGSCYRDSTENATTQSGEFLSPSCAGNTFTQTVWYSFTATASNMWVQLDAVTFTGSGATWGPTYWAAAVYNTSSCFPTSSNLIGCANSNTQGSGDRLIRITLTGLTVGQTYLIQVGYRTGMGVNLIPVYCIRVGDQFTPVCNTCASPCGPACGFSSTPTVSQVTSTCPSYTQTPYLEGGMSSTQCYTFTAINTTVSFNVILNSTCGSGNVSGFSWSLYQSGSCGSAIQTGTLSNLTFTGLTIGTQYTYCYSFTVPTDCYHTAYWPYFVGAAPLPVELLSFTAGQDNGTVQLNWSTASETNSSYFQVERSRDGKTFYKLGLVPAAGNSTFQNDYAFKDYPSGQGIYFYRLKQVDYDGRTEYFGPVAVKVNSGDQELTIFPNPAEDILSLEFLNEAEESGQLKVIDIDGRLVYDQQITTVRGLNTFELQTLNWLPGFYFIQIRSLSGIKTKPFIRY